MYIIRKFILIALTAIGATSTLSALVNCSGASFSTSDKGSGVGAQGQPVTQPTPTPTPVTSLGTPTCTSAKFLQPTAQITNKVDILLVLHNTGSFQASALTAVSNGLQTFIQNLPANADYRISTISALNGTADTALAGQVYGTVMSSANLNPTTLISQLTNPQQGTLHGEYGLSAAIAALTTQKTYNQNMGALRPGAALAVVFLANEADICGLPATDPKTDDDYTSEYDEGKMYCNNVTPQNVLSAVQTYSTANGAGYLLNAVVFTDKGTLSAGGVEQEYGWGYYSLIHDVANGNLIDLASGSTNIAAGIGAVGKLAAEIFSVHTDFTLNGTNIDPSSIQVTVTGEATPVPKSDISYLNGIVHLSDPAVAGGPGATVTVSYCTLP